MVELADNPKLDLGISRPDKDGLIEENQASQKISVLDHLNGLKKADNFVIDMESFNNGTNSNKDNNSNSNSRITRSLSRKGSSRGGGGSDTTVPAASSSPRGSSMPEKVASPPLVAAGTNSDHSTSPLVHHQITITSTPSNMNASMEGKFAFRRNSFKRPPFSLAIDPKRVLFFFATLSSMGTIVLIYFTLSMGKYQG